MGYGINEPICHGHNDNEGRIYGGDLLALKMADFWGMVKRIKYYNPTLFLFNFVREKIYFFKKKLLNSINVLGVHGKYT